MRYAALSAAVFGGAIFLAAGSHASASDAPSIPSIINPPAIQSALALPGEQSGRQYLPLMLLTPADVRGEADRDNTRPSTPKSESKAGVQLAAAVSATEPVVVTVAAGDNLTKLAEANSVSYQRLYDANPGVENPDVIQAGQQLRVPAADEQLANRPLPVAAPAPVAASTVSAPVASAPRTAAPVSAPAVAGGVWDELARCESGGNWAINTGNGFYGGLQFTLATWQSVGGSGYPHQASREEQIMRGEILQARSGWGQWPACTARMGLR